MGLRPGRCYRDVKGPAYTRYALKRQDKDYLKGAPALKIRVFTMGTSEELNQYDYRIDIKAPRPLQLRQETLEAARLNMNNFLGNKLSKLFYFARVLVFPHHILRENKQSTGAGADRVQQGMTLAFGKKIGRAARVSADQSVLSLWVYEKDLQTAREATKRAISKFNGGFYTEETRLEPNNGRTLDDIKKLIEENPELSKTKSQLKEEKAALAEAKPAATETVDEAKK